MHHFEDSSMRQMDRGTSGMLYDWNILVDDFKIYRWLIVVEKSVHFSELVTALVGIILK